MVPLIQFAGTVRPLSTTGLDLVGVGDLETPEHLMKKLRTFDSIVSWYGTNRPEFRDALAKSGVPCEFHAALPPLSYKGHAIDFFAAQVGAPAGLIPRIQAQSSTTRDSVVIHPFSGGARKNWPLHRYCELAAQLPCEIEWSAGPEEQLPEAVRFPNLPLLADWMAGARLYIGNDSGITHLAAAIGTRTLALFGPTAPGIWGPRGENVSVLRRDPIEQLQVEEVLSAANRLLDSR